MISYLLPLQTLSVATNSPSIRRKAYPNPMAKLYTKTGDDGTTGLFGNERVSKDHPRVQGYGTLDELNAAVGLTIAGCDMTRPQQVRFTEILTALQSRLFDIGADLATPEGSKNEAKIYRISDHHVTELETWIDEVDGANAPMTSFVLPGGSELAARLHLARTICRRAERLLITLAHEATVGRPVIQYLNRLSDLLFAMARLANRDVDIPDVPWIPQPDASNASDSDQQSGQ